MECPLCPGAPAGDLEQHLETAHVGTLELLIWGCASCRFQARNLTHLLLHCFRVGHGDPDISLSVSTDSLSAYRCVIADIFTAKGISPKSLPTSVKSLPVEMEEAVHQYVTSSQTEATEHCQSSTPSHMAFNFDLENGTAAGDKSVNQSPILHSDREDCDGSRDSLWPGSVYEISARLKDDLDMTAICSPTITLGTNDSGSFIPNSDLGVPTASSVSTITRSGKRSRTTILREGRAQLSAEEVLAMPDITLPQLLLILETPEGAVEFAAELGLVANRQECGRAVAGHGEAVPMNFTHNFRKRRRDGAEFYSAAADRFHWVCFRCRNIHMASKKLGQAAVDAAVPEGQGDDRKQRSVREKTVFLDHRISIGSMIHLIYIFCMSPKKTPDEISAELGLSKTTIGEFMRKLGFVCQSWVLLGDYKDLVLGGPNVVIEMDTAKVLKARHRQSDDQKWVVDWRSYKTFRIDPNERQRWVNHKLEFADPKDEAESTFDVRGPRKKNTVEGSMYTYMWRRQQGAAQGFDLFKRLIVYLRELYDTSP